MQSYYNQQQHQQQHQQQQQQYLMQSTRLQSYSTQPLQPRQYQPPASLLNTTTTATTTNSNNSNSLQQQQQQQDIGQTHDMTATAGIEDEEDPDDEELNSNNANSPSKRSGRRKIKIEFIEDKTRRHITFSKRKAGIMKKAYELSTLTGTQVLLLVVSETGLVYTFTTPKLQPLVTKPEGKNLIQSCLNSFEEEDQQQHQQQQQITNNDSNDDENSYLPSTVVGSTTSPSMGGHPPQQLYH